MAEAHLTSASCTQNQGPIILAVSYCLLAITIVVVSLRIHIRVGLRKGLHADDYTTAASLVSYACFKDPLGASSDRILGRCSYWDRLPY